MFTKKIKHVSTMTDWKEITAFLTPVYVKVLPTDQLNVKSYHNQDIQHITV